MPVSSSFVPPGVSMRLIRLFSAIVALTFTCISIAQPMADRLPASTLLYTGWSPNASLQSTRAARMLADARLIEPWQKVVHKLMLSLPDELGDGGGRVSEHLAKLLAEASQCEGCFALLELKPHKGEVIPQAVLILNLGARRGSFEQHFKPIQAKLKERLGERLHMMKLENSWLWTKTDRDRPEFTWGFLGDSFIFYFGDAAEKFIPTLSQKPAISLKDSPEFAECLAKLPGESVLTTYVDAKEGLALLHALIKESNDDNLQLLWRNWKKVTAELGLDNLRAVGEKTVVEDEHFVTRTLFRTQGPPHGLIAALLRPAVDDAMLKVVPPDALFAVAGRLDLAKTYDQIKASAIAIAGEDGRKAFGDIEDAAAGAGLPIHTILDPLGEQWVFYEAPSTGGFLFTGVTLVVDVKDADKLTRTLSILKKLLAAQFSPDERAVLGAYEADGVTIQYVDATRGFNLFSPAWAVTDHKLVIALYPQVVEDALRQFKANKSILDQPAFVETRKRVTASAGGGAGEGGPLIYVSGSEFVSTVYPLALPFLLAVRESFWEESGAGNLSVPAPELLPSLQRLLQYVGSDGASFTLTPDGVLRTKSVANPLLSPFTLTDSIPLWVAAALPSMATSKVSADRTRSAVNLRQIGQGIMLYVNENQGKMPPDLAAVAKTQDLAPEVLHSPFGEAKAAGDYTYLAVDAPNKEIPPDVVIAYDSAELRAGDGANVLYADGHVEWLERDGANKALGKAAQWRAERGKGKR